MCNSQGDEGYQINKTKSTDQMHMPTLTATEAVCTGLAETAWYVDIAPIPNPEAISI